MPRRPSWPPSRAMSPRPASPDEALLKMAKLGAVIDGWMKQTHVTISAVQCWTSMEEFFGVVPCTVMSMMSNDLIPSACEVDVPGTLSMYMLALAIGTPSALLDWNNNYGSDPNKCVCFHCSNLPKHFFKEVKMDFQEIIAGSVGKANSFGTCVGRVKAGAMSYRALLHRRSLWHCPRLHRRGQIHRRSAGDLWRRGRGRDSAAAEAAEVHLPRRLRAPRRRQLQRCFQVRPRGRALSGLGEPLPSRVGRLIRQGTGNREQGSGIREQGPEGSFHQSSCAPSIRRLWANGWEPRSSTRNGRTRFSSMNP